MVFKRKLASKINSKTNRESINGIKCSLKIYLSIIFMFKLTYNYALYEDIDIVKFTGFLQYRGVA